MEDSYCFEEHEIKQQLIVAAMELKKAETYPRLVKERFRAYCHLMNLKEQMRLHVDGCVLCFHFKVAARAHRLSMRKRTATESAQAIH